MSRPNRYASPRLVQSRRVKERVRVLLLRDRLPIASIAERLGIGRTQVHEYLRQLGIRPVEPLKYLS